MQRMEVTVGYRTIGHLRGMAKKELPDHVRAYICNLVERWSSEGESDTRIAESLGINKVTVGKIRMEGSAGLRVRDGVAARLGISPAELARQAEEWKRSDAPEESQIAPPATGSLSSHREYPAIRRRLLEYYAPRVVVRVDQAQFGQMPETLDWPFVRDIAEAVQRRLMRLDAEQEGKKSEE